MKLEWSNIEIHPETPSEGLPIGDLFPANSMDDFYHYLNQMGEPYGITFAKQERLSNSRKAILIGEYIKLNSPNHYKAYHDALFDSYFTEGKNIGDITVLSDILQGLGLNDEVISKALLDPLSEEHLVKNSKSAITDNITGTPTFLIGNERVEGAQPYSVLLAAAKRANYPMQ